MSEKCAQFSIWTAVLILAFAQASESKRLEANDSAAMAESKGDLRWTLALQDTEQLASDNRFPALLHQLFGELQVPFWHSSLEKTAADFLGGPSDPVLVSDDRYVVASACVAHFCSDRGLIWIDAGQQVAALAFIDIDQKPDGDNQPHLWLFLGKHLPDAQVPPELRQALTHWCEDIARSGTFQKHGHATLEKVTRATVISADTGAQRDLPPEELFTKS
jgi:hypothetical protein